jgi:hypothetical protein
MVNLKAGEVDDGGPTPLLRIPQGNLYIKQKHVLDYIHYSKLVNIGYVVVET